MRRDMTLDATQRSSFDQLVDAHLHALRESDIETALSRSSDDVEYDLVGRTPSSISGLEAVRAHHLREFANTMYEREVPLRRLYGEGFVVDELIWEGRITGRIGHLIGNGRRVSQRILRIFEVREGLIARQTLYADFVGVAEQLT